MLLGLLDFRPLIPQGYRPVEHKLFIGRIDRIDAEITKALKLKSTAG